MDRGKRLSRSNVISIKGESLFRQWAIDNHLSANKADSDLGIDFLCQVLAPVSQSNSLEAAGHMLGAQVKTVEDADAARIVLNRLDAEDLLRQTQATCLFGLHLQKETVHFQFVNQGFMDSLLGLLDSKNKTFTIPFAEMSSDRMLFERQLRKLADPIEQSRLRIHLIKRRLKKAIPGIELYVGLTDDDTTYRVDVPWISAAFSIAPHARETARLQLFHEGTIDPHQGGVALHPAILRVFDEMKISKLTLRGAMDRTERLTIQWKDKRATQNFEVRIFEDEVSYVHKSGLRLTTTAARKTPDGYVHEFQSDIFDSKRPAPLKGSALIFFRMFRENAVLTLPGGAKLPLSQFGKSLTNVGLAVDVLPSLSEGLSLPLSNFFLQDIKDEEFARATWFLDALLFREIPLEQMARGFIVGPAADMRIDRIPTRAMSLSVPVVVNVKNMGIVVWVECEAEGFLHEGFLCGLRILKQRSWRIEKTKRQQKSVFPELWITADWPGVPIGSGKEGVESWNFDSRKKLPFEAIILEKRSAQ